MENIFVNNSSSESSSESSEEEDINERFLNMTKVEDYIKNRNDIFTKDIETIDVLIEDNTPENIPHKYYFSDNTNTNINTNGYKTFKNVIDISLIKAFFKYDSTSVNDIIKIIVKNIPHKSCIQNKDEENIIDIIPINNNVATTAGTTMLDKNYFFPITLDHLEIDFKYVNSSNNHTLDFFSIVFRLTIVKNLNLLK